ncbi:DUF3926 domain-containing protein [Bacillus cytotoxicus]|uniref:DUF3926 domain-containing protein n=1 Tax=Bacillus cereus group sp. BfR-BA-01492 TaxID=2920361 RepID=UPI001F59807E|nr:DUF3926 domain-containing protein [Bacillus cereus group sp. BfR-BA-01492]EMA6343754.1 DUF3926 domain-containing protein [Bacillus cytotoxicus]
MHEDLLRQIIRIKVEIGMYMVEKLPTPIQQSTKKVLTILQEELSSCTQEKAQTTKNNLQSITIE